MNQATRTPTRPSWSMKTEACSAVPTLRRLLELTVLPYRGLLVSSPILIMIVPGIMLLFRKKNLRAELLFTAAVSLIFLLLSREHSCLVRRISPGSALPGAGLSVHVPADGLCVQEIPAHLHAVALLSICINLAITIVAIDIPGDIRFPLKDVVLKNILQGTVSINPVPFSHFDRYPNIYALADINQWQPNFNSFNWGEFLFPNSLMSILPILLFWLVWLWLERRRTG